MTKRKNTMMEMMKKKWYLLIFCLISSVTICAQDDNPLWTIDNLSLSLKGDDGVIVKNNDIFNIPDNWSGDKVEFVFELKKIRRAEESEDSIRPSKIWYQLNEGGAKPLDIDPTFKSVEKNDTTWSVSVLTDIKIADFNANNDNVFSLCLSMDGDYKSVKETIHVWTLPNELSFSPNSNKTFVGKKISLTISDNVTEGLMSEYKIDGKDVAGNTYEVEAEDIGNNNQKEITYTLHYIYKFGDKIWKEDSKSAKVTVFHLPVYTPVIMINDEDDDIHKGQNNTIDYDVMPSDNVSLQYEANYGYDISNNHFNEWNTNESSDAITFIAIADSYRNNSVKVINMINDTIKDEQTLTYNINVRKQPSVAFKHIENNGRSYLFNPSDGINVSVEKSNDQEDLNWTYTWSVDGTLLENGSQNVIIPKERMFLEDNLAEKDHELRVNVICKRGNFKKEYVNNTFTHTIKVVSLPKATIKNNNDSENTDINTCNGQKADFRIEPEGGYAENLEFYIESKDEGGYGKSDNEKGLDYTIEYTNTSEAPVLSVFKFAGKNTIPVEKSTTGEQQIQYVSFDNNEFKATVYPQPKVRFNIQLLENYFYGSEIKQSVDTVYTMPSTWELNWWINRNKLSPDKKDECIFNVPEGGDSITKDTLYVEAKNIYKGTTWGETTLTHPFTAWHRAQLDSIVLNYEYSNDNNIYQGHEFELDSSHKYGYPLGWKYIWEREGKTLSTSTESKHTFIAEILGNEGNEIQTYILKVKNSIPGLNEDEDYSKTDTLKIVVWRKAENYNEKADASIMTITDVDTGKSIDDRIREGRKLKIVVPQAQYGYKNAWTYSWDVKKDENSNVITFDVPSIQSDGEAMLKESRTINLTITNEGPQNKVWETNTITKDYIVYRKPKTPSSLVQKGNGASRTLIATMAISDDQLQDNDYYLCFGHREANGVVTLIGEPQLQGGPGQTRFSMQIPQEQWNDKSNLCVFALWHYDDGTWITSGLRFINDVKEDWDGSDYSGSRAYSGTTRGGDITAIEDPKIMPQGVQAAYGLNGTSRRTLQRGLNIVRMTDGTVRKVVMK